MILGIGVDLVEIERFRTALREGRDQFMQNTFSDQELAYCHGHADPAMHFAGTFAAKEAVRKATQALSLAFHQIEVRRLPSGKPEIWLLGELDASLLISISHTDVTACAFAIKQTV